MEKKVRKVMQGDPRVPGAVRRSGGYNFAAEFPTEKDVRLLLYKKGHEDPEEEIPIEASYFTGRMASVFLPDFKGERYEYNYQVGETVVHDPAAAKIVGCREFGSITENSSPHSIRCGFDDGQYDWEEDCRPEYPYSETILYKIHVRGYTMQRNSKVHKKGTFAGIIEKIPYFRELGITSLELMPVYDFNEVIVPENMPLQYARKMTDKLRTNFWGYTKGNYFAPKPAYCAGRDSIKEFRDMIKALHKAGIECILEFYFPAEIHHLLVLQVLHHWYLTYHVDGFHLIGDGVSADTICKDPLLCRAKLIFPGGTAVGNGRGMRNAAICNEGFKQDMRRFLKSDEDSLNAAVGRMRLNPAEYGIINYITNQDGFTMMDLVSYDSKHNEANGENNRDGNSYNFSWNCGVEGPSRKVSVRKLREQQMRNAFLLLLLSQGTPMIYGGDEFGNSQQGNNNAYCQDNETGWVDWRAFTKNRQMLMFVREVIAFRKQHPILHPEKELRAVDYKSLGYPDLSYHSSRAWYASYDNVSHYIGMMFCGLYAKRADGQCDDFIYIAYNFHWKEHEFALPRVKKQKWYRIFSSAAESKEGYFFREEEELENQMMVEVAPRSISIFIGRQEKNVCIHGNTLKQLPTIKS